MVDVKEIKSIDLVSFTMMSSSVNAILALIGAIILLIFFGAFAAFIPTAGLVFASLGISLIILYPIFTFLVEITISFVTALIYNMLVPRLGGVKLGIDGNEVRSVPVVPFALILSVVEAIWAFIFGLVLAALLVPLTTLTSTLIPLIANIAANATNMTPATLPTGSAVGTGGVVLALILIIALPILVFIFGFIGHALAAIFYNFIIPRVGGVKLLFTPAGALHEISSIPVVAASLAIASVALIFGLIRGILQLITMAALGDAVGGIVALIASIIVYFIGAFIMVALITIIYNFLAPRIGGVQLGLE
jgi:hypothetical protein